MKNYHPSIFILPLLALACNAGHAAPFEGAYTETDVLGAAGDLSRLVITGIPAEEAAALRAAFARNIFIRRYASPSAPAYLLVDRLKIGVREAYLRDGYKSVDVDINRIGDTITLRITPGIRYTAGAVRMDAPPQVDAAALIAALTTASQNSYQSVAIEDTDLTVSLNTTLGSDDNHPPLWIKGAPARFQADLRKQLRRTLALALFEQGFLSAQTESTYDINETSKSADLHISVKNLGPKLLLTQVVMKGNKTNSAAVIQKFLALADGRPLDLPTLRSFFEKLYKSGRFAKQTLTLHPEAPGKASLAIELEEVPDVPALDQPLSDTGKALLRFGEWAATFANQPDDLIVSGAMANNALFPRFRTILSPRDGSFFDGRLNFSDKVAAPQELTLLLARDSIAIRTSPDRHLFAPTAGLPLHITLQVILTSNALNLGSGIKNNSKTQTPFTLETVFLPSAFLSFEHKKPMAVTLKDGILTLTIGSAHLTVDALTGRPRDISASPGDPNDFHAALVHGGLATEIEKLRTAPDPNLYDPEAPRASTLRFLAVECLRSPLFNPDTTPEKRLAGAAALERLLTSDLLAPLDSSAISISTAENLAIDLTTAEELAVSSSENPGIILLGQFVPRLYPYGSWPSTLIRETIIPVEPQAAASEFKRLYNDPALGPLGCLMAAECSHANSERAAVFAKMGTQRLTAPALSADIAMLLASDAPAPRFLRAFLTHLRDLTPEQARSLVTVLPDKLIRPMYAFYTALQGHKDQPVEKALPEITETLFPILQPLISQRLARFLPAALPDMNLAPP